MSEDKNNTHAHDPILALCIQEHAATRASPCPNLSLQGSWRPLTLAKTMRTCRLTTHLPSPVSYLMFDLNINCAAVSAHLRELLTQSIRIQLAQ